MLKGLVRSALMPVNMWLLSSTSRCTSLESASMVPGLLRPSFERRSVSDFQASASDAAIGLDWSSDSTEESEDAIVCGWWWVMIREMRGVCFAMSAVSDTESYCILLRR